MKLLLLRIYWAFTRAYLRFRGAQVGKNVRCNGFPYIKVRKGGRLIIGDHVMINAARWANAHVASGSTNLFVASGAELRIGERTGLSGTRIIAMNSIEIGPQTLIGAGCLICDSDMHEIPLGSPTGISTRPIIIGKRVFIGAQSIILKGVKIGTGAVIAAGSIVVKSVGGDSLAAGNPAKFLRQLSQDKSKS